MLRRKFYLLVALLFLYVSSVLYAGIGVNPTVTELSLAPGKTKAGTFTVTNDGDNTISVKVEVEDWVKRGSGVGDTSWLEVKPLEFELNPGESRNVRYKVGVPEEARGELMAMVFFGSIAPAGGGIGIETRFGVSVYVTIKGTEIVEAGIEKLDMVKYGKENSESYGINFGVTVENKGNVHIRPKGKVILEDKEGTIIKEVDLFYGFPVFPKAKRTFPANWKEGVLSPGEYKAKVMISYGELYGLKDKICSYESLFSVNGNGKISIEGNEND